MKSVTLVTDGACRGNPGPGGWAALLRWEDQEKLIAGHEAATTNNRMEMMAIIEGLRLLKERCRIEIVTDSQYVMKAFTDGWLANWERRGWRTAENKPVKNQDLWQEMKPMLLRHDVHWTWVRGHAGHEDNERVDQAARAAAAGVVT